MARKWRQAGTQVITRSKSAPAKEPAGVFTSYDLGEKKALEKKGEIDREVLHCVKLGTDGASCLREDVVRLRADQPDRSHHDYQNHRQHHSVLGDVLSLIVGPHILQKLFHVLSPRTKFRLCSDGVEIVRRALRGENGTSVPYRPHS